MKKVFLTSLILGLTFICTGCVKFDYKIEINDKDEISISESRGAVFEEFKSPDFKNALKSDPEMEKVLEQYKYKGYKITDFSKDDYSALVFSKDKLRFQDVKESLPRGFSEDSSIEKNSGLIKKTYKIHLLYNLPEAVRINTGEYATFLHTSKTLESVSDKIQEPIISISTREIPNSKKVLVTKQYASGRALISTLTRDEYDEIMSSYLFPEAVLTIKIPGKVTKNNADNVVNDHEYQWYLTKDEQPIEIILDYEINDFSKVAAIFSILVILGAVFALVQRVQKSDVVKGL